MPEDPNAKLNEALLDDPEGIPKGRLEAVLTEAPRWLIVAAGLAYATGFLIVSAFLESFGVRDTTGEFLRLRYLTVGFYFLMFLGSLLVIAVSLIGAARQHGDELKVARANGKHSHGKGDGSKILKDDATQTMQAFSGFNRFWHAAVRYLNFLAVLALLVGFASFPRNSSPLLWLAGFVCLTLFGTVGLTWLWQSFTGVWKKGFRRKLLALWQKLCTALAAYKSGALLISTFVAIALVFLDAVILRLFHVRLKELFRLETLLFVIFLFMLGYVLYHTFFRRPSLSERAHRIFMGTRIALSLALYYLCVLSFSYGIYPLMSGAKGGGYFGDAGYIVLVLRGQARPLPDTLMSTPTECNCRSQSKELVLIEQESNVVYVADPEENGGIGMWIKAAIRPTVYEVQMSDILSIEHHPGNLTPRSASASAAHKSQTP
jgi:hypothetical protein